MRRLCTCLSSLLFLSLGVFTAEADQEEDYFKPKKLNQPIPDFEERASKIRWPIAEVVDMPAYEQRPSKCPGPWSTPYVLVVGGTSHPSEWTKFITTNITTLVYQYNDASQPNYYTGVGWEVNAYITFMVDYYDCLPEAAAFIHGHEHPSWHAGNMKDTLRELEWTKIPGYTDINRKMNIWTMDILRNGKYPGLRPGERPLSVGADAYNGQHDPTNVLGGMAYHPKLFADWFQIEVVIRVWDKLMGPLGLGALPDYTKYVCCGQFAVLKERILLRPRKFWELNLLYQENNDLQWSSEYPKPRFIADAWNPLWPILLGETQDYERVIADEELFSRRHDDEADPH